jgi:hypothetical protein
MPERPSVIERAFEIAKSGQVADIPALREQLTVEGYSGHAAILGRRALSSQLTRMIAEARMVQSRARF